MSHDYITAQDVANFMLASVDESTGDNLTHLKLQKLLYYAQGIHLAIHGEMLFRDHIKAWKHGPVVPRIYHAYKGYGANKIPKPYNFDRERFAVDVRELLSTVFEVYGQYSATKLSELTHQESPWAWSPTNQPIDSSRLREHFTSVIEACKDGRKIGEGPVWPTNKLRFQRRRQIMARAPRVDDMHDLIPELSGENNPWRNDGDG